MNSKNIIRTLMIETPSVPGNLGKVATVIESPFEPHTEVGLVGILYFSFIINGDVNTSFSIC